MKQIKFRKDPNSPLSTKIILAQLLKIDKGNIREMMEKVDLIDKLEAGPDDGNMTFSDSEYDRLKILFEANEFPSNTRFFLDVWKDIKDYTSANPPTLAKQDVADADKA